MNKKYVIGIMMAIISIALFSGCVESEKGERAKMLDTQPTKTLTESNERKIFMGYLEQVNNPNNIQFIYLMSWDGHVIYRSTAMGKVISATKSSEPYERESYADVSSSESDLNSNYAYRNFAGYIPGTNQLMNPSGMFGHDTPGAIWVDPEGNYYEWHNGPYFISSKPLKIDVPVLRNSDIDTELERKVAEMRKTLAAGGRLSPEDKAYLMNN